MTEQTAADGHQGASATAPLPVVDVVIATHNRPHLLRAALDAALNQTYRGPIACTVVFDRSEPDRSLARESDGDRPVRSVQVVTNVRSAGLAGARNTGIEASHGEYVAFCDDDDEWLPTKIEKQLTQLLATGNNTAVTGIWVEYEDSRIARVPTAASVELAGLVRNRAMEAHPSSVVVRRDALLGPIGLVDEEIPGSYAEDFDWILRAVRSGPISVVEEPLVRVRWGQSLFSTRWQIIAEAVDYLLAKHPELSADRRGLARLLGRKSFALAALGRRREALATARRTLAAWPGERRALLAIAVAMRIVSSERLMQIAHRRGHGI